MSLFAVPWPNALLVITLGILLVSVFLPWVLRRQHVFVICLPAAVATVFWLVYENRQCQELWEGNPLTHHRILFPLLFLSWVSAITTAAISLLVEIDREKYCWMASFCRPWTLTISGVLLFLVSCWIAASDMDYNGNLFVHALSIGGGFIVSLPFLIMFSFVYAAFFAMLARKLYLAIGWLCLIAASGMMIYYAYSSALPTQRLANVVGNETAQNVTIHRLIQSGSFSDGTFTYGIISGSDNLLDMLIAQHKLESSSGSVLDIYNVLLDDDALPVHDNVYANERLTCFQDRDTGRIFFGDCSGRAP